MHKRRAAGLTNHGRFGRIQRPCRKSDPTITMMQTAEKRRRYDDADGWNGPSCWRIFVQSEMGPRQIKLDLTADEHLVLPPPTVEIFHPYSDVPADGIEVLAYDYVDAFAEKFRALAERTRPHDLYDVANLYCKIDARPSSVSSLRYCAQSARSKAFGCRG
jgi:Nucleotidyl transferase AbiEii toxin, Type IV TA system